MVFLEICSNYNHFHDSEAASFLDAKHGTEDKLQFMFIVQTTPQESNASARTFFPIITNDMIAKSIHFS